MNPASQAVIAIQRPSYLVGPSWGSFIVRIDGRRAGKIKPGLAVIETTEFTVEPGTHTVAVWKDWCRSRPLQVVPWG